MHKIKTVLRTDCKGLGAACLLAIGLVSITACAATHKEMGVASSAGLSADAVAALEETARTTADNALKAQTYLRLAMWHVSHANPNQNYSRALKELGVYVSLTPDNEVPEAVRDWIVALQEIDRVTQEIDRGTEDLKKAKQRANQLSRENKELKDSIEKLKALDLKMEEKRRQVK